MHSNESACRKSGRLRLDQVLFSLNCSASSLTSNNFLVAGYDTDILTYSPNIAMHSSNCSTISTFIMFYFISVFIPKKIFLFPLTTDRSPKQIFALLMIYDTIDRFLCDRLLSSVYQSILRCVPSIILSTKHLS